MEANLNLGCRSKIHRFSAGITVFRFQPWYLNTYADLEGVYFIWYFAWFYVQLDYFRKLKA